jgi:hypothetical protein
MPPPFDVEEFGSKDKTRCLFLTLSFFLDLPGSMPMRARDLAFFYRARSARRRRSKLPLKREEKEGKLKSEDEEEEKNIDFSLFPSRRTRRFPLLSLLLSPR